MKKFIIPALTSALLIGTASTSFAAQNPFSDVNEHHWAYKSVVALAEVGIITGYDNSDASLNGKFVGGRNITRYEMAQMLAKSLARIEGELGETFSSFLKSHGGTVEPFQFKLSNGAVLDMKNLDEFMNLLIEFREELDTLGVRLKDLEDHSDMVKWTGELRYRYWNNKTDDQDDSTRNQMQFRLFPTATIDKHWTAKARITTSINMSSDTTTDAKMTFIYAEGKYGKFNINVGKMPFYSTVDDGLTIDDFFSGGRVTYGDKFKVKLEAGRWQLSNSNLDVDDSANYGGIELLYDDDERFNFGVGYRHFKSDEFANAVGYGDKNKANIVSVGAGYKIGDVGLAASYAKNTQADDYSKSYNFELSYAGAERSKPGTWGAFVAYRYVGNNVSFSPTYDSHGMISNKKGVDFGLSWTPFKNTLTQASYFHGKLLDTNDTTKTFFGRVSFFF